MSLVEIIKNQCTYPGYIYATLCIGACTALASCTHSRPHSFLQRRRARPARECALELQQSCTKSNCPDRDPCHCRMRLDTFASGRCLTDVDQMGFCYLRYSPIYTYPWVRDIRMLLVQALVDSLLTGSQCLTRVCSVRLMSNHPAILVGNWHGPLARYVQLGVAHAPGMPGTFSPPPRISDPDMHQGTCVTHVPWCMPESLTSGFLWSRWRGKRSRHSLRMRNPQFYVSGKRPMETAGGNG